MDSELKQGITPSNKSILMMIGTMTLFLVFIIITLTALKAYNNNNDSNGTNITPTPNLSQCEYNGIKYDSGQIFSRGDSCNNCNCDNGEVSCEEKVCSEEYRFSLEVNNPGGVNPTYQLILQGPPGLVSTVENKQKVYISNNEIKMSFLAATDGSIHESEELLEYVSIRMELINKNLFRLPIDSTLQAFNGYTYVYFYTDFYSENNCITNTPGCYTYYFSYADEGQNGMIFNVECGVKDKLLLNICDAIISSMDVK